MITLSLRFFLFCYLGLCISIYSQVQPPADSASLLVAFAEKKLKAGQPREAAADAQRALDISTALGDVRGQAIALIKLGETRYDLNELDQALAAYTKSLQLSQQISDSIQIGLAHNRLGKLYMLKLNQVSSALTNFTTAAAYFKSDSSYLIQALNNVAALQGRSENYEIALKTYDAIARIARKTGDLETLSRTYNNIAIIYWRQKDFARTIEPFEHSLEIEKLLNNVRGISKMQTNLAAAHRELKNYEHAKKFAQEAYHQAAKCDCNDERVYALIKLSEVLLLMNKAHDSKRIALQAQTIALEHNVNHFNKYLFGQLSECFEATGELAQALYYKNKLARFNDSLAQVEHKAVLDAANAKPEQARPQPGADYPIHWYIMLSVVLILPLALGYWYWKKRPVQRTVSAPVVSLPEEGIETPIHHLEVFTEQGSAVIRLDQILWVERDDNYYYARTLDNRYRVRQNIQSLETLLPESQFFKVNRAVIINIDAIHDYSFWENHKYVIRMNDEDKTEFTITRARLKQLKEKFQLVE